MNTTQGALCLATTAILLLTACGADDDEDAAETAGTASGPAATAPEESPSQDTEGGAEDQDAESEAFAAAEVIDVAGNPIGTVTAEEAEGGVRLSAEIQDRTPGFRGIAVHEHGVCEVQSADQWGQIGDFNSAGAVVPGAAAEDPGVVEGEDELAETPGEGDPDEQAPGEQNPDEQAPEGQDQQPGDGQQQEPPQSAPDSSAAPTQFSVRPAGQVPGAEPAEGAVPPQPEQPPESAEDMVRSERAGALPNLMINDDGAGYLEVVSTDLNEELLMEDDGTAVVIYAEADHHGNIPERYAPNGPDAGSLATGDTGVRTACGVLEAAN